MSELSTVTISEKHTLYLQERDNPFYDPEADSVVVTFNRDYVTVDWRKEKKPHVHKPYKTRRYDYPVFANAIAQWSIERSGSIGSSNGSRGLQAVPSDQTTDVLQQMQKDTEPPHGERKGSASVDE